MPDTVMHDRAHLSNLRTAFGRASVMTEGNTPGQRNRMMRNLSALQWRSLYGRNYVYSSDYIHSHRHSFTQSTRMLARAANITEELAETASCMVGMHVRFVGALVPGTLRELSGKARFVSRLQHHLRKHAIAGFGLAGRFSKTLPDGSNATEVLYCKLAEYGLIDPGKATLKCDPHSQHAQRVIEKILIEDLDFERSSVSFQAQCRLLADALKKADMRLQWRAWSKRRRVAHVAGCMLSMVSGAGIAIALMPAAAWAAGPYVTGTLGLAGAMYATSFALRSATTVQARLCKTYRGGGARRNSMAYRSLYEALRFNTRRLRNAVYSRAGLPGPPQVKLVRDETGLRFQSQEYASYSFSSQRRGGKAATCERLHARWAVGFMSDLADCVYQTDSILGRMAGRAIRLSFTSQDGFTQIAGQTGGGFAGYDWYTSAARDVRLGKARLKWARFAGIGGADVLGGAAGCLAVSAFWGAVSKASGGVAPAVMLGGVGILKPLSGLTIPAAFWTASVLLEAPLPLLRKLSDSRSGQSGREPLMPATR